MGAVIIEVQTFISECQVSNKRFKSGTGIYD